MQPVFSLSWVTGLNLTGWVKTVNTGKSLSSRETFNLRQLSNFDSCLRKTYFLCVKVSSHVQWYQYLTRNGLKTTSVTSQFYGNYEILPFLFCIPPTQMTWHGSKVNCTHGMLNKFVKKNQPPRPHPPLKRTINSLHRT